MKKIEPHLSEKTFRGKLFRVIYESGTIGGKLFNVTLISCIVISVLIVSLDSIESVSIRYGKALLYAEWVITILFSIEFALRITCVKKPLKYLFSFMGLVDLLSILPLYLSFFFTGTKYFVVIRTFRILRIFRILKMWNFVEASHQLTKALYISSIKIGVFILFLLVLVVIIGSLMHLIEGGKHGFDSIPHSIYWAIVTLTTVGYGDIAPKTPAGRLFASVIMLLGYGIIAVPTGIVTAELVKFTKIPHAKSVHSCPSCGKEGHDTDAHFCKFCGEKL
ncbi:MAG: ion transporter [Candidatus Brocadia sp.]|jgi:voltage-gated potassium channel|uniref:Cyclic nucleotide-gated potassium channel n=1 Tax=Candidatus Brocadia fulgida TaxID=380242 RepID=A0A0M2UXZ0_9BACT|nr:MAG: Cyclic nucleotide-gated potassium channel [Candidatus Brocadia fulgida]OQZ00815.1 MAG: ion transporter [Candidatus Brocadia sp. UTAMX2]UJS22120.1 MAG: ion transporter [Candidatus Brocadia sp.]